MELGPDRVANAAHPLFRDAMRANGDVGKCRQELCVERDERPAFANGQFDEQRVALGEVGIQSPRERAHLADFLFHRAAMAAGERLERLHNSWRSIACHLDPAG